MTADLHRARCFHHAGREAVARCPSCSRDYCRECVVEHEGRLTCSSCLAREATEGSRPQRHRLRALGRWMGTAASLLLAWLVFFVCGELLVRLPDAIHETGLFGQ